MLGGCNTRLKGVSDSVERKIENPIETIKMGIPIAIQRAQEWRNNLNLNYINVSFVGIESIKSRKGKIVYFFYEENVKKNLDASAEVEIDMVKNSIVKFNSEYGAAREMIGGGDILKTEKWTIDINEAFEIAIKEIGEDKLTENSNPAVIIRCSEKFWDFAVYSNSAATHEDWLVVINPETGKVIRKEDKT